MKEFHIDCSENALSRCEIKVPVFLDEDMQIDSIEHNNRIYFPYCNYVDVTFTQELDTAKITQKFGFQTLNPSDEKYLKTFIFEERSIYLLYNFETNCWQLTKNQQTWQNTRIKTSIERKKSRIESTTAYHDARSVGFSKSPADYLITVHEYRHLLTCCHNFFENLHFWGQISFVHFTLISDAVAKNQTNVNRLESYIKKNQLLKRKNKEDHTVNDPHVKCINYIADIEYDIINLISKPGFWVQDQCIYPNPAQYYVLTHRSSDNRTPETKLKLETAILNKANGKNIYIPLNDQDIQNKLNS